MNPRFPVPHVCRPKAARSLVGRLVESALAPVLALVALVGAIAAAAASKALMGSVFPAGVDDFSNPAGDARMNSGTRTHSQQHGDLNDAVEAIESYLLNDAVGLGGLLLGQVSGELVEPWRPPATIGPELWQLANFQSGGGLNTTQIDPSITANGTTITKKTIVYVGSINEDTCFQLRFTIDSWPSGLSNITMTVAQDSPAANPVTGTTEQQLAAVGIPITGEYLFDFFPVASRNPCYVAITMHVDASAGSGTLAISNVSLKKAVAPSRPLQYVGGGNADYNDPAIFQQIYNPRTGAWQAVRTSLADDNAMTTALNGVDLFGQTDPYSTPPADPLLRRATQISTAGTGNPQVSSNYLMRSGRINNNDQIIEVKKTDGSYELRGNTHGGEALREAAVFEVDHGDGDWSVFSGTSPGMLTARRFRVTFNSKLTRSAPDNDDFANVDHTCVFFPDGMMRMDRTTTFLTDITVRLLLDWMSSHDTATPKLARAGRGLVTIDEGDLYTRLAVPTAPTAAANNAAGSLAAGTYRYVITALTEGGETTPSTAVTQAVTGGSSTVTLTLPALATGQTGWRVYGRANNTAGTPSRAVLLATLGPAATTWADDGTVPAFGAEPPRTNTARRLDTSSLAADVTLGSDLSWAVWKDLPTGICWGNIFDREALLARDQVAAVWARMMAVPGVVKNYIAAVWDDPGATLAGLPNGEALIPAGTEWPVTHWSYAYCPQEPDGRWEQEIAIRAADLDALKVMYPAT